MEKVGIEHLEKAIEAVQTLGVAVKEISKEGIGLEDLPKALELLKKYEEFAEVISSIEDSIAEAKDIDSAEAVQLVVKLIAAFKAIKTA